MKLFRRRREWYELGADWTLKSPEKLPRTKAIAHPLVLHIFLHILHKIVKYQNNREVVIIISDNRRNVIKSMQDHSLKPSKKVCQSWKVYIIHVQPQLV